MKKNDQCTHCEACTMCEGIHLLKMTRKIQVELKENRMRCSDLIISQTKTDNFVRDFDRVWEQAMGSQVLNRLLMN